MRMKPQLCAVSKRNRRNGTKKVKLEMSTRRSARIEKMKNVALTTQQIHVAKRRSRPSQQQKCADILPSQYKRAQKTQQIHSKNSVVGNKQARKTNRLVQKRCELDEKFHSNRRTAKRNQVALKRTRKVTERIKSTEKKSSIIPKSNRSRSAIRRPREDVLICSQCGSWKLALSKTMPKGNHIHQVNQYRGQRVSTTSRPVRKPHEKCKTCRRKRKVSGNKQKGNPIKHVGNPSPKENMTDSSKYHGRGKRKLAFALDSVAVKKNQMKHERHQLQPHHIRFRQITETSESPAEYSGNSTCTSSYSKRDYSSRDSYTECTSASSQSCSSSSTCRRKHCTTQAKEVKVCIQTTEGKHPFNLDFTGQCVYSPKKSSLLQDFLKPQTPDSNPEKTTNTKPWWHSLEQQSTLFDVTRQTNEVQNESESGGAENSGPIVLPPYNPHISYVSKPSSNKALDPLKINDDKNLNRSVPIAPCCHNLHNGTSNLVSENCQTDGGKPCLQSANSTDAPKQISDAIASDEINYNNSNPPKLCQENADYVRSGNTSEENADYVRTGNMSEENSDYVRSGNTSEDRTSQESSPNENEQEDGASTLRNKVENKPNLRRSCRLQEHTNSGNFKNSQNKVLAGTRKKTKETLGTTISRNVKSLSMRLTEEQTAYNSNSYCGPSDDVAQNELDSTYNKKKADSADGVKHNATDDCTNFSQLQNKKVYEAIKGQGQVTKNQEHDVNNYSEQDLDENACHMEYIDDAHISSGSRRDISKGEPSCVEYRQVVHTSSGSGRDDHESETDANESFEETRTYAEVSDSAPVLSGSSRLTKPTSRPSRSSVKLHEAVRSRSISKCINPPRAIGSNSGVSSANERRGGLRSSSNSPAQQSP